MIDNTYGCKDSSAGTKKAIKNRGTAAKHPPSKGKRGKKVLQVMGCVVDMVTIGSVTNTGVNVIIYSIIPQTTLSACICIFVCVIH